ncbi:MAG: DUF975 family protein [Bacillota bacterium]|nr:DUF975 family protein [Bacillota bacterium]
MPNIIVTESSRSIRALARQVLAGKWPLACLATLLYYVLLRLPVYVLNFLFTDGFGVWGLHQVYSAATDVASPEELVAELSAASFIGDLYLLIVTGPITLGYLSFILAVFRQREASPGMVLYGFERFGKALGLYIMISIFCFLWSLLLVIPGIIAWYRYRMAFYLLCDEPGLGILEAINRSKGLMRGNKAKLFCLDLSFIGWFLLGAITYGLANIAVLPYYTSAEAAFYEMVTGHMVLRRNEGGCGGGGTPPREEGDGEKAREREQRYLNRGPDLDGGKEEKPEWEK